MEVQEIKLIRKKIGLTQSELAKQANVSQSLIAKIEAGTLDPTYSKAKQIFSVLDSLSRRKQPKAKDIMSRRLISVGPDADLKAAVREMRKHGISQMPVIKNNNCIGLISEIILLEAYNKPNIKKAEDIMEDAPPIVAKDTTIDILSNLLKSYPIVLVSEKGELKGVITKSDILKAI